MLTATVAAFDVRVRRDFAGPAPAPSGDGPVGRVQVVERALYNPRLDSAHYMIPGLLGYIFTFLTILVAAVSIVRERVGGTFEQLMVTPVRAMGDRRRQAHRPRASRCSSTRRS